MTSKLHLRQCRVQDIQYPCLLKVSDKDDVVTVQNFLSQLRSLYPRHLHFGQNTYVRGLVDPMLCHNLGSLQAILSYTDVSTPLLVTIHCEGNSPTFEQRDNVSILFIDSTSKVWNWQDCQLHYKTLVTFPQALTHSPWLTQVPPSQLCSLIQETKSQQLALIHRQPDLKACIRCNHSTPRT